MMVEAGKPDALLTLTLRRTSASSPEQAREKLGKAIPEFFRRLQRLTGHRVPRFVVIERHQSGWPHAHLACSGWQFRAHKQLVALWKAVTKDSIHVDIRRIPARATKRYLAKYLGKDLHRFGTSKRYWRTQDYLPVGWGEPTEEEAARWEGWKHVKAHPEDLAEVYRARGWWRHDLADGVIAMTPPLHRLAEARGPPW
jgi:hypothetical protein